MPSTSAQISQSCRPITIRLKLITTTKSQNVNRLRLLRVFGPELVILIYHRVRSVHLAYA